MERYLHFKAGEKTQNVMVVFLELYDYFNNKEDCSSNEKIPAYNDGATVKFFFKNGEVTLSKRSAENTHRTIELKTKGSVDISELVEKYFFAQISDPRAYFSEPAQEKSMEIKR